MITHAGEKIVESQQIKKLFYPNEEKSAIKEVLYSIQPINNTLITKENRKNKSLFLPLFGGVIYTLSLIFITLFIIQLKNPKPNLMYEERKDFIIKEIDNVLCNLFFSFIASSHHRPKNNSLASLLFLKRLTLPSLFQPFLLDYFDIKDEKLKVEKDSRNDIIIKVEKRLENFYWTQEKKEVVINFLHQELHKFPNAEQTMPKNEIIQIIIPTDLKSLENSTIDSILSTSDFRSPSNKFLVGKYIAEKLALYSSLKKEEFQKGPNLSEGFLFFIQSLAPMDDKFARNLLNSNG